MLRNSTDVENRQIPSAAETEVIAPSNTLSCTIPLAAIGHNHGKGFPYQLKLRYDMLGNKWSNYGQGWYVPHTYVDRGKQEDDPVLYLADGPSMKLKYRDEYDGGWYEIEDKYTDDVRVYFEPGYWQGQVMTVFHKNGLRERIEFASNAFDGRDDLDAATYKVTTYSPDGNSYLQAWYAPYRNMNWGYELQPYSYGYPRLICIKDSDGVERVSTHYREDGGLGVDFTVKDSHAGTRKIQLRLDAMGFTSQTNPEAANYRVLRDVHADGVKLVELATERHGGPSQGYIYQQTASKLNHYFVIKEIHHVQSGLKESFSYAALRVRAPSGEIDTAHQTHDYDTVHRVYESRKPSGFRLYFNQEIKTHVTNPEPDGGDGFVLPDINVQNFTGYGYFATPDDYKKDPCNVAPSDYEYGTVEHSLYDDVHWKRVQRTYNKYHLLIDEKESIEVDNQDGNGTQEILLVHKHYTYPADVELPIEKQPANFDQATHIETTFHGGGNSRTEHERFEHDKYGNITKRTHADGSWEELTYESLPGTDMEHLVKSEKVFTPGGQLKREKHYEYKIVSGQYFESKVKSKATITSHVSTDGSGSKTLVQDFKYFEYSGDRLTFGRNKEIEETLDGYTSTLRYDYTTYDHGSYCIIKTAVTEVGHDGVQRSAMIHDDWYIGKTVRRKDYDGIFTEYEYYLTGPEWGKPKAASVAGGTPFQARREFSTDGLVVIMSNPDGLSPSKYRHDALGRQIEFIRVDAQGIERVLSATSYDALDRKTRETEYDYFSDGSMLTLVKRSRYFYRDGCEVTETTHPDGRVEVRESDAVNRTETHYFQGEPVTVEQYDALGQVSSETITDTQGRVYRTDFQYENGHLVSTTTETPDGSRRTVSYQYDAFGRVTRIDKEGEVLVYEYIASATAALPTKVQVLADGELVTMGERQYDGLKRLKSEIRLDAGTVSFDYEGGASEPDLVTTPRGPIHRVYNYALGEVERLQSADGDDAFAYYPDSGRKMSSSNAHSSVDYVYNALGQLTGENRTIDGVTYTSSYLYSLGGRLEKYVGYFGDSEEYEYFPSGAIESIEYRHASGTLSAKLQMTYNEQGLPDVCTITRVQDGVPVAQELVFSHDDFGQESSREYKDIDEQVVFKQVNQFDAFNRLDSRETFRGNAKVLTENYTYDVHDKATQYDASGSLLPKDRFGNAIVKEEYRYHLLHQLDTKITRFADGQTNTQSPTFVGPGSQRIAQVTNTHGDYQASASLAYSDAGDLLTDEKGRQYEYNGFGYLKQVKDASGTVLADYFYNAEGQLIKQQIAENETLIFLHRGDQLVNELSGNTYTKYNRAAGIEICRIIGNLTTGEEQLQMSYTDRQGSVIERWNLATGEPALQTVYTPFGVSDLAEVVHGGIGGRITEISATPASISAAGQDVVLSVSATDPQDRPLSYLWSQISGPSEGVVIADSSSATTTVSLPATVLAKSYVFGVTIRTEHSQLSGSLAVQQAEDRPPIVDVAPTVSPSVLHVTGGQVTLSVQVSDPDSDPLTYRWSQHADQPAPEVTIHEPDKATTLVTVPPYLPSDDHLVANGNCYLYFEVTYSDGKTTEREMVLLRQHIGEALSVDDVSATPMVVPGTGGMVTLAVVASDPGNGPIDYLWTQVGGDCPVPINDADKATATAQIPYLDEDSDTARDFTFDVAVSNAVSAYSARISIIQRGNETDVMLTSKSISPTEIGCEGGTVILSASAYDPDGYPVRYSWTESGAPTSDGGILRAEIEAPDAASTSARIPPSGSALPAVYTFYLNVSDGHSSTDHELTLTQAPGNLAPVIESATVSTATVGYRGAEITLSVVASDREGVTLSYQWLQVNGTLHYASFGTPTESVTKAVIPESTEDRTYEFQVEVSDGLTTVTSDVITVRQRNLSIPVITAVTASPASVGPEGGTATLTVVADDPDGDPLSYSWTQIVGSMPTVPIVGSGKATAEITLGSVLENFGYPKPEDSVFLFKIEVSDGTETVSDRVEFTQMGYQDLKITSITATPSRTGRASRTVALSVTATHAHGTSLSYQWTSVGETHPAGGGLYIQDSHEANASVTIPSLPSGWSGNAHCFEVAVGDGIGTISERIKVEQLTGPVINELDATPDGFSLSGATVTLSVVAQETDPGGGALTYEWSQSSGPSAGLVWSSKREATVTVTIPARTESCEYRFSVSVAGANGVHQTGILDITQSDETVPVIRDVTATPASLSAAGGSVSLTVAATDPDGDDGNLRYQWTLIGDAQQGITIDHGDKAEATVFLSAVEENASYTFQIAVSDEAATVTETLTVHQIDVTSGTLTYGITGQGVLLSWANSLAFATAPESGTELGQGNNWARYTSYWQNPTDGRVFRLSTNSFLEEWPSIEDFVNRTNGVGQGNATEEGAGTWWNIRTFWMCGDGRLYGFRSNGEVISWDDPVAFVQDTRGWRVEGQPGNSWRSESHVWGDSTGKIFGISAGYVICYPSLQDFLDQTNGVSLGKPGTDWCGGSMKDIHIF